MSLDHYQVIRIQNIFKKKTNLTIATKFCYIKINLTKDVQTACSCFFFNSSWEDIKEDLSKCKTISSISAAKFSQIAL